MVTSVIELADKLYKTAKSKQGTDKFAVSEHYYAIALSRVCCNANDLGLPLSVVQQLLKGTDYEQLLS